MLEWLKSLLAPPQPSAPLVWIAAELLDRTAAVLHQSGDPRQAHEGVVYWAGRRAGNECFVTTLIAPSAQTTRGSFRTSSAANARVVIYLANAGLELLGQVHSHPGSLVDHSDGDDEDALMPYDGFYSLVVPNYASQGMRPLSMCGVHLFEKARFRRLANSEINARFRIVDGFSDLRS
jgi:proteasome lid subunit RPN8/RPN11